MEVDITAGAKRYPLCREEWRLVVDVDYLFYSKHVAPAPSEPRGSAAYAAVTEQLRLIFPFN